MKKFVFTLIAALMPIAAMAAGGNETVVIKAEPIAFGKAAQNKNSTAAKTPVQKQSRMAAAVPVPLAAPAAGATLPPPPPPAVTDAKKEEAKKVVTQAEKKTVVAPAKTTVKTETKAAVKPTVKTSSMKPQTTTKVDPAPATRKAPAQVSAATSAEELKRLNKQFMLDFLRAAKGGTLGTFYRNNPQFSRSITEAQFVRKFEQYSALDDDTAAIEANDFADTTITDIKDNKRYRSCQMVEAKSRVQIQVVQDAHKYSITNKYCRVNEGFKLVSFKFGYDE